MARKKRPRVTLQQVAEHAGVSRATASLIVRGSPNVSEATREKVLKSMRELGYVYDRVAANLRSRRSNTVGLIITEIANPFFHEFLVGVHQALDKKGYTVILGTTFDLNTKQEQLLSTMLEYGVGGVIMSPVPGSTHEELTQLQQWDIPVVLFAREASGANCDYIGINNIEGGQIAVNYLISKGHRRISILGGTSGSSAWRDRKQGYINAFQQNGLEIDESLILEGPATRQGGIDAVRKLLRLPHPPSAIFCYNDIVALGVMIGLKEAGLTPGKDIAVVGFDNIQEASISNPGLTTVSAFPELIGMYSAELLHKRITGYDDKPQRIILKPELVVRESCSGWTGKNRGN